MAYSDRHDVAADGELSTMYQQEGSRVLPAELLLTERVITG